MLIPAILALLGLAGLILSITSGLVTAGVDGVFIILVCLMTMAIFGGLVLRLAVAAGYIPVPARFKASSK
jgi:hypothetical protein